MMGDSYTNMTTPELLQRELKTIRLYMDFSTQELADYLGVTRQTINNLESGKTKLSATQVIALFAIIDQRLRHDSREYNSVRELIGETSCDSGNAPSLLKLWFDCLELNTKDSLAALNNDNVSEELSKSVIFIMYDFLMERRAIEVLKLLAPYLLRNKKQIILPRNHALKLIKVSENGDVVQAEQAKRIMEYFVQLNADNLMQIRGKESDIFEDDNDLIEYIMSRYSSQEHIAILKQNVSEVETKSEEMLACSFYYINSIGVLEKYSYLDDNFDFCKLLDDAVRDDL